MTFEEWSDLLYLREKLVPETREAAQGPWRCTGPCGQLMYGIDRVDSHNYPSPFGTPAGMFISKECPHVCHVCWEMFHVLTDSPYWHNMSVLDKKKVDKLGSGGAYLST